MRGEISNNWSLLKIFNNFEKYQSRQKIKIKIIWYQHLIEFFKPKVIKEIHYSNLKTIKLISIKTLSNLKDFWNKILSISSK